MRYCLRFFSYVLLLTALVVVTMLSMGNAFAQAESLSPTIKDESLNLSPTMIEAIQSRYRGRVVGVMPHNPGGGDGCREFSKQIKIDGKLTKATGLACKDQAGGWKTVNYYDVQVLTHQGRIILLTVDASNGEIIQVRE